MSGETILGLVFISSFMVGVWLTGAVEWAIKRIKAHKKYVNQLQAENRQLKRENNFLLLEIQTRGL